MKKVLVVLFFVFFLISCWQEDSNARLKYSSMWAPTNCRALITENIKWYNKWDFSAEEALNSINRNCWEYGSEWKNSKIPTRKVNPYEWTLKRPKWETEKKCEEEKQVIRDEYEGKENELRNEYTSKGIKIWEAIEKTNQGMQKKYNRYSSDSPEVLQKHTWSVTWNTNLRRTPGIEWEKIKTLKEGELVNFWPGWIVKKDWYTWVRTSDYQGNEWFIVIDWLVK